MDYIGTSIDGALKEKTTSNARKVKNLLTTLQEKTPEAGEQKKIKKGLELLEEAEQAWKKLAEKERELARAIASCATMQHSKGVDVLYSGQEPIHCEQYATIAKGLFRVLKSNNKGLATTEVAIYTTKRHWWNQVSTVYRKGNEVHVDFSLFDVTWYDGSRHIEGFDWWHFSDENEPSVNTFAAKLGGKVTVAPLFKYFFSRR